MTSVLKPQAPFERLKFANSCPEVALRKAIVLQARIDASNISDAGLSNKVSQNARNWLFNNSEGFIETCINADLDPQFVAKISKQLINLHNKKEKKICKSNIKPLKKPYSSFAQQFAFNS